MEKNAYEIAKSRYAELGVNTYDALNKLKQGPERYAKQFFLRCLNQQKQ
jgi:L-rhamnose isomerase